MKLEEKLNKIIETLNRHEKRLKEFNVQKLFSKIFKRKLNIQQQTNAYRGLHLALCVDTRDPLKQNRVKFFNPVMDVPLQYSEKATPDGSPGESQVTKIEQLDWAWPISSMGGFDDCGLNWVPPPGSMLVIFFLHDNPGMAFYAGTTWYRDKGPIQHDNWNYHIPEYYKIFEGHRGGYMVGANDESQVLPPQNTDNYQGLDNDTLTDVEVTPDVVTKTTFPHIYSLNSPEKHRVILDDGDPKCNRRWKRLEIISSMGHLFLMKDDPYHHCGEWLNPQCYIPHENVVPEVCAVSMTVYTGNPADNNISFIPIEIPYPCFQGPENCPTIPDTPSLTVEQEYLGNEHLCPSKTPFPTVTLPDIPEDCLSGIIHGQTDVCFTFNNKGKNKYQKHRQQCFPYYNQQCGLIQSGIQIQSRSGVVFAMDDSVEEPRERTEWERALKPYDMDGCTGNFKGRTYWKSATGHFIEMNDTETQPKVRSAKNGITIGTASGNTICLNDHTKPGCIAGESRGIHIQSTSNHTFDMVDNTNQQCSDERVGCAKVGPYAQKAFIRLRTGYGTSITMADNNSQTKTDQQYLQLMAPQKDNLVRGPHVLHMQERANGKGQFFIRAGGQYITYSYDEAVEVVGETENNPTDKLEFISRHKIVSVDQVYYNRCGTSVTWADDYIFLLTGKSCGDQSGLSAGAPCIYPVVVAYQAIPQMVSQVCGIKASETIFASALPEPDDPCEGIKSDS